LTVDNPIQMLYFWLWKTQLKCCIFGCSALLHWGLPNIFQGGKTQNDASYLNNSFHIFEVARLWRRRWSGHKINIWGKTNSWYCGVVFVVHRDRPENWFLALTWLQVPDYCPLIRHNPGLLLACLLDITPWEDIYIQWGWVITPPVGNVVLRRKPQSTFCVNVRPWLHSDIHIWVPPFWNRRISGN
jgi:hypothetical protein